ncbi:hypothetical protein Lesp02_24930 [Lentzea sp. NBRC 105346]|uniref:hypothetical protein n=1 Tax=Lentzea sp. NBRC 105346 TaxID=3032205 RepID=UPI0025526980|nr:hypothetical protein [Lentzea sp. NBRC 105346]GLZ30304.1 hypothetical protein Lesp02_24930 [Lentzea sp. NBRC 105346]
MDHVELWRPVGQAGLDLVAASGWRAWPALPLHDPMRSRSEATTIARQQLVPAGGVGYVTRFRVCDDHVVGAIENVAEYRGPVPDEQFDGLGLPEAWRTYLRGESWLRRGWVNDETYVHLYSPVEMLELQDAWGEATALHPGIAIIGGDGGREQLALDLREAEPSVRLVDIASGGWEGAVTQAGDVRELIERIEAGDFAFTYM